MSEYGQFSSAQDVSIENDKETEVVQRNYPTTNFRRPINPLLIPSDLGKLLLEFMCLEIDGYDWKTYGLKITFEGRKILNGSHWRNIKIENETKNLLTLGDDDGDRKN